jgi:hypothetical protein
LDEIQVTGAITTPVNPILDPTTIPLTSQCPASAAANCNQALGTNGFTIDFKKSETDGDGWFSSGEEILLDASQTTNPGGCANGVPQFQFKTAHSLCVGGGNPGAACPLGSECTGGGTCTGETAPIVLQDWSTAASVQLSNWLGTDHFDVSVRCSSDFSCLANSTSEPVGQDPKVFTIPPCPFRLFQDPATAAAPHPAGFTTWSFGAACAGQGAPGALICASVHRFDADEDPLAAFPLGVGFAQPPVFRGQGVITTAPLPVAAAAAPCAAGDFGICIGTPWAEIGFLSPAVPICGKLWGPLVPLGPLVPVAGPPGQLSCDPIATIPVGAGCGGPPNHEITCGDAAAIPVGTVQYYLAGLHSRAVAPPVGGCTAAGIGVVPGPPGPLGPECYRFDDDPVLGGLFAPAWAPGTGCP